MNDGAAILQLQDPSWLTFVESRQDATPFHHPLWTSLVADCYRLRGFAFVLKKQEEIVAGLPLVEVGRRRRWVSVAFTDYCTPLGEAEALTELIGALDEKRLAEQLQSVELRSAVDGMTSSTVVGFRHLLTLDEEPSAIFRRFNRSQVQRGIKRAERDGVRVRRSLSKQDLDVFYALHVTTRRRLGVPVQPKAFFDRLWQQMISPGLGAIFVAEVEGAPIAAALFLGWNQNLIYKFGASERSAWSHRPNHALFWSAIQWACENGYVLLDFGRTELDNEGLRAFKASWGTVESDLVYSTLGVPRTNRLNGVVASTLGAVIRHSPEIVCRELGERLYRHVA
jgi:CelD/BcsL family acetyltransferase involved in cellulose biosynthesis